MVAVALSVGGLLALVIVLLAVPLTVVFSIHRIEETEGYIRFLWLFGLVCYEHRIPKAAGDCPRTEPKPTKRPKPARQCKKKGRARGALALLSQPALRRRGYRFVRDMLRATHPRDLVLRLRVGLGDPADTGRLWGVIGPVAGLARNLRGAAVRIEPEFMDPVFEVESHGEFRLVPVQLIALTAAFVLSPTMLWAWWGLRRGQA